MADTTDPVVSAARSLLAAREYRLTVARQLRQGTGHPDGLRRARRGEANAARALRAAVAEHDMAGSLKESRPDDIPVEAAPLSCGVPDAALVLLDAWAAFQEALDGEARDAICSACGRHPCHQVDHAPACPVAALHAVTVGDPAEPGGLEALRRQQTFHEGWCAGFGDGRATAGPDPGPPTLAGTAQALLDAWEAFRRAMRWADQAATCLVCGHRRPGSCAPSCPVTALQANVQRAAGQLVDGEDNRG